MNNLAPIVIFAYNRSIHLQRTIEALSLNKFSNSSELIVYSDAPKNDDAVASVREVRSFLKTINGFKNIRIIEREKNYGLANSIMDGVSSVLKEYDKLIVLEDDLITSPHFLTYMNEALNIYENDNNVASIHGYIYPTINKVPDYFFLLGADCLGWATWRRAWSYFNPDSKYLLNLIKNRKLEKLFNFNNSYNYTGMLQEQAEGKNTSWAVRWYASAFLNKMHTLYPGKSFVNHIGDDGSGTNCGSAGNIVMDLVEKYIPVKRIKIKDSKIARKAFTKYFLSIKKKELIIYKYLKKIIKKLLNK